MVHTQTHSSRTDRVAPMAVAGAVAEAYEAKPGHHDFGGTFPAHSITSASTITLAARQVLVAHVCASKGQSVSASFAPDEAFLVILGLDDSGGTGSSRIRLSSAAPGADSLTIVNLREGADVPLPDASSFVALKVPERALSELLDHRGAPDCKLQVAAQVRDSVLNHLARTMVAALDFKQEHSRSFFEYVTRAICLRLAHVYGVQRAVSREDAPTLGPVKARLAQELLASNLAGQPDLDSVARQLGVSADRFVRLFRGATGLPPHRWLRSLRVERAKELMLNSRLSLAQIALECGFADQSHFTRVFSAAVHMTPAGWRKARR